MGNADRVYEQWRANAARQLKEDRFTPLWEVLLGAYMERHLGLSQMDYYNGLLRAYILVTGDVGPIVENSLAAELKRQYRKVDRYLLNVSVGAGTPAGTARNQAG